MEDLDRLPRRLVAILYADVVDYSRLTGEDEDTTHRTLSDDLDLISTSVERHRGHVMHYAGDAVLAMFEAVVDALSCAAHIQRDLATRNHNLPDERKVQFRVGVNLGDVIEARGDIYGDGVNVAARLESLAEPGGICISESVQTAVGTKLPFEFEFMGEQRVKNISQPIRTYHARLTADAELPAPPRAPSDEREVSKSRKRTVAGISAALAAAILAAVLTYWKPWQPREEPASLDRMAYALPNKPSIAVLPFHDMSGDAGQEYFSDGLTENVITTLSKLPEVFVIARNSTFAYKGRHVKVQRVAEELGIRYVLEGSFQRADERIRVHAQLIDALNGHHIWAERFDRSWTDIFSIQDDITQSIVSALALKLTEEEKARVARRYTDHIDAYEFFLQGQALLFRLTETDNQRARELYERAIDLDAGFARAYGALAITYINEFRFDWGGESAATAQQRALEFAETAVRLDKSLPQAQFVLGQVHAFNRNHVDAIDAAQKTIALDGNFADAYALLAVGHSHTGRSREAIPEIEKAMRLNPHPPAIYYLILGRALYFLRRYQEAVSALERAIELNANNVMSHIVLAAAYAKLGKEDEADWQKVEITTLDPDLSIETWKEREILVHQPDLDHLADGLRKAGIPETAPATVFDNPSIVVLPFDNMSNNSEQEYFVDGLTEDLITDLSRISGLFVIARNSSFVYKGRAVDVREVSRDLGVKYVLEGSVRRADHRIRVNTQLIDATTGTHIWAERYDRVIENVFDLQDDITARILSALEVRLTNREQESAAERYTKHLDAYDSLLRGLAAAGHRSKEANLEARGYFEEAIEIDPQYARAYSTLANTYRTEYRNGWSAVPERSLATAYDLANKALEFDESLPQAHFVMALVYREGKEHRKAIVSAERVIELDPNYADAFVALASVLCYSGRAAEGLVLMERAVRLNPHHPSNYPFHEGQCYFVKVSYDEAIDAFERGAEQSPDSQRMHVWLAASYSLAGNRDDAEWEAEIVQTLNPEFSVEGLRIAVPFKDPRHLETFFGALRMAGLPG